MNTNNNPRIEDSFWLCTNTFTVIFNDQTDTDGDKFNYEVEYHEDEDEWTAVKVYDCETIPVDIADLPKDMLGMAKKECFGFDHYGSASACVFRILQTIIPKEYVEELRDNILNDVVNDLVGTANDDWNDADVASAIGRVLLKKTR